MKCAINRASWYGLAENSPCKGAYKEGNKYFIDINKIEDLVKLIDKEGSIILDPMTSGEIEITIYDDYIE